MQEELQTLSKIFYLMTILLSLRLWYLAWKERNRDKFIYIIFSTYIVAVPMYIVFSIVYAFDVEHALHGAYIEYMGWAIINALFLSTDVMLMEYIINHTCKNQR